MVLLLSVLALLVTSAVTFATGNSVTPGCYIDTSLTLGGGQISSVNEGQDFYATVRCIDNSGVLPIFGFEFGTTFVSPNSWASVVGTTYTSGTFMFRCAAQFVLC